MVTILEHYREAVEFVGIGPWGFKSLIHMDVHQLAKEHGCGMEDFEVTLSKEKAEAMPEHVL